MKSQPGHTPYILRPMPEPSIPLLLISGPVGVGKTTVGNEVSMSLDRLEIAHTFIDMDALAWTYPRPQDDRFGRRLALANLRDVWANSAVAGSLNLIVADVAETLHHVKEIQRAVPGSKATVCQLHASDETLIERVGTREHSSSRTWHERRALELSISLRMNAPADFVFDADGRSPQDIANDIVARVEWATKN